MTIRTKKEIYIYNVNNRTTTNNRTKLTHPVIFAINFTGGIVFPFAVPLFPGTHPFVHKIINHRIHILYQTVPLLREVPLFLRRLVVLVLAVAVVVIIITIAEQ